jgi:hypothetical protein
VRKLVSYWPHLSGDAVCLKTTKCKGNRTTSKSWGSVTSTSRTLTPRNPPEIFYFLCDDIRGVVSFRT